MDVLLSFADLLLWNPQGRRRNQVGFFEDAKRGNSIMIIKGADNLQLPYSWKGRSSNGEFMSFRWGREAAQGAGTELRCDKALLPSTYFLVDPLPSLLRSSPLECANWSQRSQNTEEEFPQKVSTTRKLVAQPAHLCLAEENRAL